MEHQTVSGKHEVAADRAASSGEIGDSEIGTFIANWTAQVQKPSACCVTITLILNDADTLLVHRASGRMAAHCWSSKLEAHQCVEPIRTGSA